MENINHWESIGNLFEWLTSNCNIFGIQTRQAGCAMKKTLKGEEQLYSAVIFLFAERWNEIGAIVYENLESEPVLGDHKPQKSWSLHHWFSVVLQA